MANNFFTYVQNNSGGYFIRDEEHGVGCYVIIEAKNAESANNKLRKIGKKVKNFFNYCSCCGERWDLVDDTQGKDEPLIYGYKAELYKPFFINEDCYIHTIKNGIKKIKYAKP